MRELVAHSLSTATGHYKEGMKDEFKTKWLIFRKDYTPKKITETWEVRSFSELLGIIKWYAPWRCYSFYPLSNTIFNST